MTGECKSCGQPCDNDDYLCKVCWLEEQIGNLRDAITKLQERMERLEYGLDGYTVGKDGEC